MTGHDGVTGSFSPRALVAGVLGFLAVAGGLVSPHTAAAEGQGEWMPQARMHAVSPFDDASWIDGSPGHLDGSASPHGFQGQGPRLLLAQAAIPGLSMPGVPGAAEPSPTPADEASASDGSASDPSPTTTPGGAADPINDLISRLEDPRARADLVAMLRAMQETIAQQAPAPSDEQTATARTGQGSGSQTGTGSAAQAGDQSEEAAATSAGQTGTERLADEPEGGAEADADGAAAAEDELIGKAVGTVQSYIDERVDQIVITISLLGEQLSTASQIGDWIEIQAKSASRQRFWINVLSSLAIAFAIGIACRFVVMLPARQMKRRVMRNAESSNTQKSLSVLAMRLVLDLVPLVVFVGSSAIALAVLAERSLPVVSYVGWMALTAVLIARTIGHTVRNLLMPAEPAFRMVPLDDALASSLYRWTIAVTGLISYGYAILQMVRRLGLPLAMGNALGNILFITCGLVLTIFVLRLREPLIAFLHFQADRLESGFLGKLLPLRLIAAIGPWLVIGLIWLHYVVYALGVEGGFTSLLQATAITIGVFFLAQALSTAVLMRFTRSAATGQPLAAGPADQQGEEIHEEHVAVGAPLVVGIMVTVIRLAAFLVVLEAWDLGVLAWLQTTAGQTMLETLIRVGIMLGAALLFWLLANRWFNSYLLSKDGAGNLRYSNRTRTLATIGRNVVMVLTVVLAGATILAELGIETAPLLAGAGVIGLAIGFGSQRLVQDIITGLFMLLGDTMRVGDVVDLEGKAGVVEAMSMRTVTLRSYNGDVHTIPFGSINMVTNMTKDFSFAVFDVGVAYHEDVDHVIDVMEGVAAGLRRVWPFRRLILEPLEIAGLDQFADSAVIIKARLKVRAGEQWRISREYNRRLKARFDELGIEIPFPHQKIYFANEPQEAHGTLPADVPARLGTAAS